ncbi:MAG: hypothetical protein IJT94_00635 [Oscillibacter sp.]|nr:hypothetical protein [Oscillibacter sp.]
MEWTVERRSRAAFFALNYLAVFPLFLPVLNGPGTAAYLISIALGAYLTVYCPGGDEPACAGLPVLLTLDLWALLSARIPALLDSFSLPDLSPGALVYLILAAAGIALSFTILRDQFWTRTLARTGGAAALFLAVWDGAVWFPLTLLAGTAVLWQTARDLAEHSAASVRGRDDILSALVYGPILFLICFETEFLYAALPRWFALARELCTAFFRGPWAAVPPALLIFCALASIDRERAALRLDGFVLLSCLSFYLLLLAYGLGPFAHGWILLAAFWTLFVRSARCAAKGRRFLRLEPKRWLPVQFAVFLASILLVRHGLYGNLLVSIGAAAAIFVLTRNDYREGNLFWMVLLLAVFSEAAAWLCVRRLCGENLAVLLALAASSFLTMAVLGMRHGHPVPVRWRAAVCALAALGCLCLTVRHGVRAAASFDDSGTVRLRVEAREEGDSVSRVSYQWKTWGGDRAEVSFQEEELELTVRGERLVVTAADDHGVQTVSIFWTPWSFPED